MQRKPLVYIASPYSFGDPGANTHFQCRVFDSLLSEGIVTPLAPLWTHFQHVVFPRTDQDWIEYDLEVMSRCDAVLRLEAIIEEDSYSYCQSESVGADNEVRVAEESGIPVFYSVTKLYAYFTGLEIRDEVS